MIDEIMEYEPKILVPDIADHVLVMRTATMMMGLTTRSRK
jgi:hypothetical protein